MEMIGEQAGSYRIVRKLGEGGMGVVYLAEHPLLGKKAAVKMLLPEFSSNRDMLQRFFNEARATTLLNHPGIIEVFDFGHHPSGSAFIVMEFLEGESLAARLRREKRMSVNQIIEIGRQIGHAVGAAHDKGIIHRDLKPDNVYLLPSKDDASGIRVKVLDFGIAKLTGASAPPGEKTRAGLILGTPTYMSPEQCQGAGRVDLRTDIYALGCMLFEMATGHVPYAGESPVEVITAHVTAPVPPLEEEGVERDLADVIRRAMSKDVAQRYQTMAELVDDLERVANGRKPSGPYAVPARMVTTVLPPPGVTVTPTTLGHVAAEMVSGAPPHKRRWVWPVSVAGVLLLAGAGAATYFLATSRAPEPTPAAPVVPVVTSPPPPPAMPPPAPPAAPATVKLRVESVPPGAEVYRAADGVRLGRTPHTVELSAAPGEAVFLLKLEGYDDARLALPAGRDGAGTARLGKRAAATEPVTPPPPEKPRKSKRPAERGVLNPYGR